MINLKFIIYLCIYLVIWYYVPDIHQDYQFIVKTLLLSVPFFIGAESVYEIQEEEFTNKEINNKVIGQLVDLNTQTSIALVYNDGTVKIFDSYVKKLNKNKQTNWYSQL